MPEALLFDVKALLAASPPTAAIFGFAAPELISFPHLAGALLGHIAQSPAVAAEVRRAYDDPALVTLSLRDIHETARRNFEPGGAAAALLFSRGVQAVMAHRAAHALWSSDPTLALALKSSLGRALATDIHPAAQIGAGFWLDHGLGCVIGETTVIGDNVSIWHNVTLGSTLTNSGPQRHPLIGDDVVIGAGATLLGRITIGQGANIAAGAIVLQDVPSATTFAGQRATAKGPARVSFQRPPA